MDIKQLIKEKEAKIAEYENEILEYQDKYAKFELHGEAIGVIRLLSDNQTKLKKEIEELKKQL